MDDNGRDDTTLLSLLCLRGVCSHTCFLAHNVQNKVTNPFVAVLIMHLILILNHTLARIISFSSTKSRQGREQTT